MSSHLVISSCRAVPSCVSCLLRCVLALPPHLMPISSVIVSPVVSPLFDTVGLGVRRGAFASCLLGSVLRASLISIAGSCRFLCDVPSVCLPVGSAAGAMAFSSRPCGMCCDVMLTHRLASSRLSSRLSSHRSGRFCVSRPVLRHDGRGVGRLRRAIRSPFRFLAACLVPLCLLTSGRFSFRLDADGGGGWSVGSAGGLPACLSRCIRVVLPPVSSLGHSISWFVRLVRLCAVP